MADYTPDTTPLHGLETIGGSSFTNTGIICCLCSRETAQGRAHLLFGGSVLWDLLFLLISEAPLSQDSWAPGLQDIL